MEREILATLGLLFFKLFSPGRASSSPACYHSRRAGSAEGGESAASTA